LNNSLIANNTIVGARRNGIISQYNGAPNFDAGQENDKEVAVPFDNVIVNNVIVSENDPDTDFRGAYRFDINDNGDTDPNTGVFYPGYQPGDFTRAKTNYVTDPNASGFDAANLKRGNNIVANNAAYLTDGVGSVTIGISIAGFLVGNPQFDSSDFRPAANSILIDAGQVVSTTNADGWSTSGSTDFYGNPRTTGSARLPTSERSSWSSVR